MTEDVAEGSDGGGAVVAASVSCLARCHGASRSVIDGAHSRPVAPLPGLLYLAFSKLPSRVGFPGTGSPDGS